MNTIEEVYIFFLSFFSFSLSTRPLPRSLPPRLLLLLLLLRIALVVVFAHALLPVIARRGQDSLLRPPAQAASPPSHPLLHLLFPFLLRFMVGLRMRRGETAVLALRRSGRGGEWGGNRGRVRHASGPPPIHVPLEARLRLLLVSQTMLDSFF